MSEDNDRLRPWTSDERLKDLNLLTKIELTITTIEEITDLIERLSEGPNVSNILSFWARWNWPSRP
jgi:hypothetical protein